MSWPYQSVPSHFVPTPSPVQTNFVQQVHQAHPKTDNNSSVIYATTMNPLSGVEAAPPAFPYGTTSVIVHQSCNHCGQKFTDEPLLPAHIQKKTYWKVPK